MPYKPTLNLFKNSMELLIKNRSNLLNILMKLSRLLESVCVHIYIYIYIIYIIILNLNISKSEDV